MIDFEKLKKEYEEVSYKLSSQEILADRNKYQQLVKRFSFLERIINLLKKKENYLKEEKHLKEVISNPKESQEVKELAQEELKELDKS